MCPVSSPVRDVLCVLTSVVVRAPWPCDISLSRKKLLGRRFRQLSTRPHVTSSDARISPAVAWGVANSSFILGRAPHSQDFRSVIVATHICDTRSAATGCSDRMDAPGETSELYPITRYPRSTVRACIVVWYSPTCSTSQLVVLGMASCRFPHEYAHGGVVPVSGLRPQRSLALLSRLWSPRDQPPTLLRIAASSAASRLARAAYDSTGAFMRLAISSP